KHDPPYRLTFHPCRYFALSTRYIKRRARLRHWCRVQPRICRGQRGLRIKLCHYIGHAAGVLHEGLGTEMDVPAGSLLSPCQLDLLGYLLGRPAFRLAGHPAGVIARNKQPLLAVFPGPPREEFWIALLLLLDRPIELWGKVIDPAFVEPLLGVGK